MQNPAGVTTSLFGDKVINGLVFFQSLLYADEKIDAVNHTLDQLHLWEAETVRVRDVKSAAHSCRVNTAWKKKQIIYMLNDCGGNLMRNAWPKSACSYQFRVSAISVCPKFRQILNPVGKTKCSVLFIELTEPNTRQIVPSSISAIPCFKRFLLKAFI